MAERFCVEWCDKQRYEIRSSRYLYTCIAMLFHYLARITGNIRNTVAAGDLNYMGMPCVVTPNNLRSFLVLILLDLI